MRRLLLLASLVAAAVAASTYAPAADAPECAPRWWPQPRQSSCGDGSAADPAAPSPEDVAGLRIAWTYRPGTQLVGQPVVTAGPVMRAPYVYVVAGERLHALELATGKVRWTANAGRGGGTNGTQPVAERDVLLHVSQWGVMRRYVPRSGHIVWQRTIGLENGPERQVVAGGTWFMTADRTLLAYDARTGRPRWSKELDCFHCDPAAAGGRLYVAGESKDVWGNGGRERGALHAYDARTGDELWTADVAGAQLDTGATPALAAGRLFVRTMSGCEGRRAFAIEAFRTEDGTHLWHAHVGTTGGFWFTPPAADGSLVVYPSEDGALYALDAATGKLRWQAPGIDFGVRPAIVNGLVWAGDEHGRIVALDARDGRRLWSSEPFGADGPVSPVLAGGFLLVATYDGRLVAYRVG